VDAQVGLLAARGLLQLWRYDKPALSAGMGVLNMAKPRQTATTATPARAPRKPAGRSKGNQSASGRKARNGRESASKATTAKPNPFDEIARQVNADQEAKDRQAGRGDLTLAAAKSVDQAKVKPSGTRRAATKPATPTKPTSPRRLTKDQASGNGVTFGGRPTTKVETVAARVKKAGLRVRADADVDAIAARLRATPAAVSAWLATRGGAPPKPQAKARSKQPARAKPKPRQMKSEKASTITLTHVWGDKRPDWLYRCTLVTRYEVRPDGTVWSTLEQVLGPDGTVVEDFWRLPLDYRPTQQVTGNGRKLVLKDRTIAGLQTWLIRARLTRPDDSNT
jgi:hypothetical protein